MRKKIKKVIPIKKIEGISFEDMLVRLKKAKPLTQKQMEETKKILEELGPSGPIGIWVRNKSRNY